jgi:hypothetical protein
MSIGVEATDRAASFLARQGVPHERDAAGGITVSRDQACGVLLELTAA